MTEDVIDPEKCPRCDSELFPLGNLSKKEIPAWACPICDVPASDKARGLNIIQIALKKQGDE